MLEAIAWFYNNLMLHSPHLSMIEDSIIQIFANMIENLTGLFENENVLIANAHILTGMDPGPAYEVDDLGARDDKATLLKTRIETWFVRAKKNVKLCNVLNSLKYAACGEWNSGYWRNCANQAEV